MWSCFPHRWLSLSSCVVGSWEQQQLLLVGLSLLRQRAPCWRQFLKSLARAWEGRYGVYACWDACRHAPPAGTVHCSALALAVSLNPAQRLRYQNSNNNSVRPS